MLGVEKQHVSGVFLLDILFLYVSACVGSIQTDSVDSYVQRVLVPLSHQTISWVPDVENTCKTGSQHMLHNSFQGSTGVNVPVKKK